MCEALIKVSGEKTFEIGEIVGVGNKDKFQQGVIVKIVLIPETKAYDKYYVINIDGENLCYLEKEIYKLCGKR